MSHLNCLFVLKQLWITVIRGLSDPQAQTNCVCVIAYGVQDGYFMIRRGANECGIEEDVVAGLPSSKNFISQVASVDAVAAGVSV